MHTTRRLFAVAAAAVFGVSATAAMAAGADPTIVEGNPTCSDLDPSWQGLKYDGGQPGAHHVSNSFASATITIEPDAHTVSFESQPGVIAVIVKAGPQANVYEYSSPMTSDSGLDTGSKAAV